MLNKIDSWIENNHRVITALPIVTNDSRNWIGWFGLTYDHICGYGTERWVTNRLRIHSTLKFFCIFFERMKLEKKGRMGPCFLGSGPASIIWRQGHYFACEFSSMPKNGSANCCHVWRRFHSQFCGKNIFIHTYHTPTRLPRCGPFHHNMPLRPRRVPWPWIDHLILWTSGHAHPSCLKTKNCNAKQYDKTPYFLVYAILPSFLLFFEKEADVFRPLPMVPSFSPWRNHHLLDFYHLASYQKVTKAIGGWEESEKGEFL